MLGDITVAEQKNIACGYGLDVFLYLQELLANMTDWDHTDEYLEDLMPWSEFTRSQCCR